MSNKRKNVFMSLHHIEQSIILYSLITKCFKFCFASIITIAKKHDKIILLAKAKLNTRKF